MSFLRSVGLGIYFLCCHCQQADYGNSYRFEVRNILSSDLLLIGEPYGEHDRNLSAHEW